MINSLTTMSDHIGQLNYIFSYYHEWILVIAQHRNHGVLKHDCQKCVQTTAVVTQSEWSAIKSLKEEACMLFHNLLDTVYKKNVPLPESANRCSQYTQSIYKNIGRNYVNKTYKPLRSRKDRATTNTSSIKFQFKLAHISDRVKFMAPSWILPVCLLKSTSL